MYFHPDLISGTSLYQDMDKYGFFDYNSSEALHLSEKERLQIEGIIANIQTEINSNVDNHSQEVIVSNIHLLLNYCKRFYERQFLTRTKQNKDIVSEFESLLKSYYQQKLQLEKGIVNLDFFSEELNLSKSYLSDLIKRETGKDGQGKCPSIYYRNGQKRIALYQSFNKRNRIQSRLRLSTIL